MAASSVASQSRSPAVHFTSPDVVNAAPPTASSLDPRTQWREGRSARRTLAEQLAPGIPDAMALVELLDQEPEQLVRQLPTSAREALALCDDPHLTRDRLVAQVERDPSLVQAMLRTANSVAFGTGRDAVLGLAAAIDRIGIGGARGVLMSSCASNLLSHPGGEYNAMASAVWAHMIRTGPVARAVAPAFAADPDEAFTLALLHDIGKLIVFDRLSVLRATRRRAIELPAPFVHQLLQSTHEVLGAVAVFRWELGPRAASAIADHHRRARQAARDPLAEVLFLAEAVDHAMRTNATVNLDQLWADGTLSGSPARAASALQRWAGNAA